MHSLDAAELLSLWDSGSTSGPLSRALDLLEATHPDLSREQIARLPVGARDRRLLELRERLFGSTVAATVNCPTCGERLDLAFRVRDVIVEGVSSSHEESSISVDGWTLLYRLPNTLDLASLPVGTIEEARAFLLERCVRAMHGEGGEVPVAGVPVEVIGRVVDVMETADPQADVQVALDCPACGRDSAAPFDIVSYLLSEIEEWALRMLREIHTLASAYGWREQDVLALSPRKRQAYIAMVNA